MCNVSWVPDEKAENREGDFSAQFSGITVFSMELYLGDQLCSKCNKKVLSVTQLNDLKAYKYSILMTLQSAIASTVQ